LSEIGGNSSLNTSKKKKKKKKKKAAAGLNNETLEKSRDSSKISSSNKPKTRKIKIF